jgi:hypothetical protein
MTDSNVLDSPITTKQCKVCLEIKELTEFYRSEGRHRSQCKRCLNAACAQRHRSRPKPVKEHPAKTAGRALSFMDRVAARQKVYPPIRPCRGAAVTPLMLPLTALKFNQCHYPYDAPDGSKVSFLFCGLKKVEGKPYCGPHCEIAYRQDELSPIRLPPRHR